MANRMSDANAGAEYGKMLADSRAGGRPSRPWALPGYRVVDLTHRPREWAAGLASIAGSYGRHAEPLDQRAREDRYRKQTGRANRCQEYDEDRLDFMAPAARARLLGLTPKQRRRSEHKERRADARLIPGGGR